uniref:Cyclin-dependent protein kinase inhibitor SMR1 n=1 Tax=Nicotiana sylvestris TaxID=4096 RepID=A0A1U7VDC9_NICSY|nr:PREDICTED: cyclin-dependent protein kinase inhibitor SMR1 [Nicotiana sylvestris]
MSTDLELSQDLLEIQLPKIKVTNCSSQNSDIVTSDDEDKCQTPKSPQFLIPKILSCPPAPKKPKRVSSCKRKLLDFFEIVKRDEIDSFFKLVDVNSNGDTKKRRCLV